MRLPQRRKTGSRRRLLRGLLFRLAAVAIGLAPFVLAEGLFTLLDWGRPDASVDPFVGFHEVRPLFVPSQDQASYEIPPSRYAFFRPESFAAVKEDDEYRVFCLGGSTVQGRPWAIETSFTTWLELALNAAQPERRWQVVNCGGVSYASYRLTPILQEVLGHEPDLIIVYTGHNEFLEDRSYGHIKDMPGVIAQPCSWLARTRSYTLLDDRWRAFRGFGDGDSPGRPTLTTEAEAMLELDSGLGRYHRDDKWRRDTIAHFRFNLERMVRLADEANVPLLLMNPVCNLRDCPPFKSQHRDGLTDDQRAQWRSLFDEAVECQGTNLGRAVSLLEKAATIDDQHAGQQYLLATCYDLQGRTAEARDAYLRAKELDVCPLRILEPMNEALLRLARRTDTPLVDVRKIFERLSPTGVPGKQLIDHVHPTIKGHQLIADALAEELIRQDLVRPTPGWKEERSRRYQQHYDSLPNLYFAKGIMRLNALKRWTQGKVGAAE